MEMERKEVEVKGGREGKGKRWKFEP